MVLFSLNFKFFNFNDPCPFTVGEWHTPLLAHTLWSGGSPGVVSPLCDKGCLWGEELKLSLSPQLPSKASSHSLRVGNWSERKSHRLPRLPKRHSHDDMLLLAQLGIPSSPSGLSEDSLSTASELLSTRRARRIPKVLPVLSLLLRRGLLSCEILEPAFIHHWKLFLHPKGTFRSKSLP